MPPARKAAPPATDPAQDPPQETEPSSGVTLDDVKRLIGEALAGSGPAAGAPAAGDDIASQLRDELAKIRKSNDAQAATSKRVEELEAQLKAATAGNGGDQGGSGGAGEKAKKVAEQGPSQVLRGITRTMWGDPDD